MSPQQTVCFYRNAPTRRFSALLMRLTPSGHIIRWRRQLLLSALVSILSVFCTLQVDAQNLTFRPPQVERGGDVQSSVLFRSNDTVTIRWEEATDGLTFKIGLEPGEYGYKSIRMRGDRSSQFTPSVVGLPVGVYYGVLTDSDEEAFTAIQIDASGNPDIHYSREIRFAVESEQSPRILAPRGTVADRVPTFEWEAIPGVTAYALVVSNSPFTISSSGGQITDIEGLNPVWIHVTTESSARYGELAVANPLIQFAASPLVPGRTYYYSILNAYSTTDPAFLSVVLGPVVNFTLENRGTLDAPVLVNPEEGSTLVDGQQVTLAWDPVPGALSYDISLFERLVDDGFSTDLQVFAANTSNTSLSIPARQVLRRGLYRWFVIANDREGAASVSETASFRYDTPMGKFTFETRSATDGEELFGVTVSVRSTDGGYSPANPFVNRTSVSFSDSLSVGSYEFRASKDGYADVTVPVVIRANERTQVPISMPPLPARIIGQVVDGDNAPVQNADVTLTEVVSGEQFTAVTSSNGVFSADLVPGTFEIRVTKTGYRPAAPITVSVAEDQTVSLPEPLVIIDDEVSLSGRVVNQDGISVAQARVRATTGSQTLDTVTDGNGEWSLELSEGTWRISASRDGFLAPLPREYSLLAGDAFTNINFVLVQQASRIEGLVRGYRMLPDGNQEVFQLAGAVVTARPLAGAAVTTTSDEQGRFQLDLGTGAYAVSAYTPGFDPNGTLHFVLEANETIRDVAFSLEAWTSTVFGTMLNGRGEGVSGAVVRTSAGGQTTSGSGGAFALPVPSGSQTISATHTDYTESDAVLVAPTDHEQLTGLVLTFHDNAARLSGTVMSARGPVSNMLVQVQQGSDVFETRSGPDGTWSFQLPAGPWDVSIISDRYRQVGPLLLNLRSGASLSGTVIDVVPDHVVMRGFITQGGQPVAGARLDFVDLDESTGRPITLSTLTAADGSYALVLGALTRYQLQIDHPGSQPFTHTFTTPRSGLDVVFDTELNPSQALLTGRVVRSGGGAITDATVEARVGTTTLFEVVTQFDGSFSLSVEAGGYQLTVIEPGFAPYQVPIQVAAGQQLTGLLLELSPETGNVSATIINPIGGAPIKGARMVLNGPTVRTALSDAAGGISFSSLPVGVYEAVVEASGFQSVLRSINVQAQSTSSERFILVPANGRISGTVRESGTGTLLEGVTLRLLGSNIDLRTETNASGQYTFSSVPIGAYTVQAQRTGYGLAPSVSAIVTAATPEFTANDILLTRADGRIEGRVSQPSTGSNLSGVEVRAVSSNGAVSTRTRTDGTFTFVNLESGSWTLQPFQSGYRGPETVVTVSNGQTTMANLTMVANQGRLSGLVRAVGGEVLPFDVSMEVLTASESFQTFTTAPGAFSFEALPIGEAFILRTRMQREGYVDLEQSVTIPAATGQLDVGTLAVALKNAAIAGNAGTSAATVTIRDAASGASVAVVNASSSGAFSVANLPPDTYEVTPVRPGFQFSPASQTLTIASGETGQVSFTATSAIGIVQIAVTRSTGEGVQGVQMRISSLDRTYDQLFTSDVNGLVLPPSIPLGARYRVEPMSEGFRFTPETIELDLVNQTQQTVSFTVADVNSFLTGVVRDEDGNPVAGAQIQARLSVNEQFSTQSAADGTFSFGPIPGGSYTLTATRIGFITATRLVVLPDNQTVSSVVMTLEAQSVRITGRVLQAGEPVSGLTVRLVRPITLEARTDADGRFLFEGVPVQVNQSTVAELAISRSGRSDLSRTLSYSLADVGTTLSFADIFLASGRITLMVTDGQTPLPDLRLDVQGPEGRVLNLVTGSDGVASTPADLDPGVYLVTPVNASVLMPPENTRRVTIADAQAAVNLNLVLPYRHIPPDVVRSDQIIPLFITYPATANPGLLQFVAEVTVNGDAMATVPFQSADSRLEAFLPAPGERELSYRVVARDILGVVRYMSETYRFVPVVAGRLQSLVLQPDPHDNLLRTGTPYTVSLQIRDGLGEDLTPDVQQRGTVQWTAQSNGLTLQPFSSADGLGVVITPVQPGTHVMTVQVQLGTEIRQITVVFTAGEASVASISIQSPQQRIRNDGAVLQLQASGLTATGDRVLLGDAVSWSVQPGNVADISSEGRVSTSDARYIGPISIVARDNATGLADTVTVSVFAQLDGATERALTDHAGTDIVLPAGAIPFRSQLSLSYPRQPVPRRFETSRGSEPGTTAGTRVVRFSLQSDRSLLGDTLLVPARVALPPDASMDLFEGGNDVGFFDRDDLSWSPLPSAVVGQQIATDQANRMGDYSIVSQSDGLAIRHLAALPTPFSPEIAPLKIGYFLESPFPPASVRVDILSVRGELVRRLVASELQWPGRYGSRSGLREIEWDGLTDDGKMARNGRYVIRVEASDRSGRVSRSIPVVLIK